MVEGWSYVREGNKVVITSPEGKQVVKFVSVDALDEGVKSFMSSLTVDQLKTMFKGV